MQIAKYRSVFKESLTNQRFTYIAVGLLMLFTASQISIPIKPVPITLQTIAVLLIALIFERKAALSTIAIYIGLGLTGFPMFAGFSGGAHVLAGPTGGYIAGFAAAIWVITLPQFEKYRTKGFIALLMLSLLGQAIIFATGLIVLSSFIGFEKAIQLGFIPFLIPGIVKCFILTIGIKACRMGE